MAGTKGGELARRNGIRIGVAKDGLSAALQAAVEKSKGAEAQKMWLTVLSGTKGHIMVGEGTWVEALRVWTRRGENVVLQKAFIGASLVVEPTVLPEGMVRVRLHPRFASREGKMVDLTDLTTEVVVRHGQPIVIGGLDQSSDSAGWALFTWNRNGQMKKMVMLVTPYID